MTVNEMAQKLKELQDKGLGGLKLYTEDYFSTTGEFCYKELCSLNTGNLINHDEFSGFGTFYKDDENVFHCDTITKLEKSILCK